MADGVVTPPSVPGSPPARWSDALRFTWWTWRGFAHGIVHGHGRSRVTSAAAFVGAVIVPACLGILVAGQVATPWMLLGAGVVVAIIPGDYIARIVGGRRTSWYVIDGAALAVLAARDRWTLSDHTSAHPGSGAGRRLRDLVLPTLIAAADRERVALVTEAADPRLAEIYLAEIPGMQVSGPAFVRGFTLRRDPQEVSQ